VAAAADPTGPMTRPPGLRAAVRRRGWLLPYVTVPVVMIADVLLGPTVNLAAFLVLAPVLASRLLGRTHVALSGLAALSGGMVLGFWNTVNGFGPWSIQQSLRLFLIAIGTLFALITQDAYRREQSALTRSVNTIALAGSLLAGVEPEEASSCSPTRPGRSTPLTSPPCTGSPTAA
jgi:hypothetical protein